MAPRTGSGTVSEVLELAEVTVAKKGRAGDDTTEMKLHATDASGGDGAPKPGRLRNKRYLQELAHLQVEQVVTLEPRT